MPTAPECPECRVTMRLREARFGPFYACPNWPECEYSVSAHRNGEPMGTPADRATRRARRRAHKWFDGLWRYADERTGVWSQPEPERSQQIRTVRAAARRRAYKWLAHELGIPVDDCHIAQFDIETCERVVEAVKERLAQERS